MASITKRAWLLVGGILAAAIIVGGVIGYAQSVQSSSEQVTQLLREGDAKYAENDLAGALRLYMEAENLKPNSNQISDKIKLVNDRINSGQGKQVAQNPNTSTGQSAVQPVSNQDNNTSGQAQSGGQDQPAQPAQPAEAGKIPNLIGMSKDAAEQQLLAMHMRYAFDITSSDQPANTVFKQDPQPGQPYAGQQIQFYVSSGK